MLRFDEGRATCLIHAKYGYEAKPVACREHDGDERCRAHHEGAGRQNAGIQDSQLGQSI
jgi:hypothetical protein